LKYGNVIFTNGGTMANNMIIHGLLRDAEPSESEIKSEIIRSQNLLSQTSILRVHEYYAKRGFHTRTINVDEKGYIDIERLKGYRLSSNGMPTCDCK
jgi:cysteine sulfinate desulfinase/cysteine desulfurase-like protein